MVLCPMRRLPAQQGAGKVAMIKIYEPLSCLKSQHPHLVSLVCRGHSESWSQPQRALARPVDPMLGGRQPISNATAQWGPGKVSSVAIPVQYSGTDERHAKAVPRCAPGICHVPGMLLLPTSAVREPSQTPCTSDDQSVLCQWSAAAQNTCTYSSVQAGCV
jgi:hypothetical protein